MLLLINRRYPALGAVLGVIAAATFIVIGVAAKQPAPVVMGVISLAISIARAGRRRRSDIPLTNR
jgi:hypothetical protein